MKTHVLAWLLVVGGCVTSAAAVPEWANPHAVSAAALTSCLSPWIDASAGETAAVAIPSSLVAQSEPAAQAVTGAPASQTPSAPRPLAVEYSDGYQKRFRIHKYASYATLPLFVAQFAVGQKLYDGNASDGTRSLHTVLAGGTGALFVVNSVTGVWNLREGRQDPSHRKRRMVHGLMMLAADAGFAATGLLAPEGEERENGLAGEAGGTSRSTHRAIAIGSMGIATAAYLLMLVGD